MRPFSKLLLHTSVLCLVTVSAFGSGFSLFEQGAKASGMAGAFAATADDPSAIFYNVAGIAQLRRAEMSAGVTLINFANEFKGSPSDPLTAGTKGEYRNHTFTPPNAYFIIPFENNLTFGVGVMSPFGLRTDWADPWVGRFVSKDANLKAVSVQPSVAWRSDDGTINIGGGVEYRRAHVILSRNIPALNPFTNQIVDIANARLNSDWNSAFGYNVGVLFRSPDNLWRFGASYRSRMTIDFDGTATFTPIPTGNAVFDAVARAGLPPNQQISTSINFPGIAIYAIGTSAIPNWDVEFDVTHTTWERFKEISVNFATTPSASFTRPQNWHNTFSYRLGANRRLGPNWDLRLGAVYDENPQPVEAVGPLLPDSDRIGASIGVGFHRGPWVIDISDLVLHFKDRDTRGLSADNFNGVYTTDANLIMLNFGYRF